MLDITRVIPANGLSKKTIAVSAESIIQGIKDGNVDPIKVLIALKGVEAVAKEVGDFVKQTCQDNAEQYKGVPYFGAKISTRGTAATYNLEADEEYASLKKQLKAREAVLKEAIKAKSGKALTEDGEVVEAPPMVKPAGQTIVVSFNKE